MGSTKLRMLRNTTAVCLCFLGVTELPAQQSSKPGVKPPIQKATPPRKPTEAEKAAQAVLNDYTDAANFQNNGKYSLAIGAWKSFSRTTLRTHWLRKLGIISVFATLKSISPTTTRPFGIFVRPSTIPSSTSAKRPSSSSANLFTTAGCSPRGKPRRKN